MIPAGVVAVITVGAWVGIGVNVGARVAACIGCITRVYVSVGWGAGDVAKVLVLDSIAFDVGVAVESALITPFCLTSPLMAPLL